MKTLTPALTALIAVSTLAGCDLDPGVEPGTFATAEDNNNSVVEVTALSESDDSFEARTVETTLTSAIVDDIYEGPRDYVGDIQLTDARVVQDDSSDTAHVYFELVNDSAEPLCFVQFESLDLLDEDGMVLGTAMGFIDGSAAVSSFGTPMASCLTANGGFGVVATRVSDVDIEDVASVDVTLTADNAIEDNAPLADIVATSYTAADVQGFGGAALTLENQGTVTAKIAHAKLIRFDEDGEFLGTNFIHDIANAVVAPGEHAVASVRLTGGVGTTHSVMINVLWQE